MSNTPGEWERDELGRKFRRIGASIEYAPTITTSYGTFEMGAVPPAPKPQEPPKPKTWGSCPYLSKCTDACAMYGETGCGIVTGKGATAGRRCPFADPHHILMCGDTCALWARCSGKES